MKRLMDLIVLVGFVTAWFLAGLPTTRSPSLRNATTDGVVRSPSALMMIVGSPPSSTAIAELVVPRSMPRTLAMFVLLPSEGSGPAASRARRVVHTSRSAARNGAADRC